MPTPTLVPPGACPTGSPIAVEVFGDADPACFGAADVEIRGWLDSLPAIGFMPPGIAPGWLYFPTVERALWSQELGPDQECLDEAAPCSYYFVQIDPASGLELVGPPRWVIVTGHLQDPAAETCHYVYPDDWTEPPYDDADAVATCRTRFVGVATRDAP